MGLNKRRWRGGVRRDKSNKKMESGGWLKKEEGRERKRWNNDMREEVMRRDGRRQKKMRKGEEWRREDAKRGETKGETNEKEGRGERREGGREGGNRNQRERSTAGRRQTDTHFKHTHSQQHTEMHKNFKHLNVGVCSGGSVRIMTFLTWLEGIYNLTHAHTNTQKPSQSFKFWSIISHACHRSGRTRTFAWHHRHTHTHTLWPCRD